MSSTSPALQEKKTLFLSSTCYLAGSLHPELLRGSKENSEVVAIESFTCFIRFQVGQVARALEPTGMR